MAPRPTSPQNKNKHPRPGLASPAYSASGLSKPFPESHILAGCCLRDSWHCNPNRPMTLAPSIPAREMMRTARAFPRGRLSGSGLQGPGPAGRLELRSGGFLPPQGEKPPCPPPSLRQISLTGRSFLAGPPLSGFLTSPPVCGRQVWKKKQLSPLKVSFKIISVLLQITNMGPAVGEKLELVADISKLGRFYFF